LRDESSEHGFTLTLRASRQIVSALEGWQRNRSSAPRLLREELDEAIRAARERPRAAARGRAQRRSRIRRRLLRQTGYLLFYRVDEAARCVEILALWHARRAGDPLGRSR